MAGSFLGGQGPVCILDGSGTDNDPLLVTDMARPEKPGMPLAAYLAVRRGWG